jgi:sulfur-oxidizing protein SoxY
MKQPSRRTFITAAGACVATTVAAAWPALLHAQMVRTPLNNMPDAIRKLAGAKSISKGRVKLDVPPLVENGHLVPLSVSVDSPMSEADHVKAIHIFTERNPLPEMATFRLGPRAGRARVATRVRMADTQNVIAIAELSDGSFWSDSAFLIVTLAACLEELPA